MCDGVIGNLVGSIEEIVSVFLFLLLLQSVKQLLVLGGEIENLLKILVSELVERVPKASYLDVKDVVRAERELRLKLGHLRHVSELSQMLLQHLLEKSSYYFFFHQISTVEVQPQIDLSLRQLELVIFLEKSLDIFRFI